MLLHATSTSLLVGYLLGTGMVTALPSNPDILLPRLGAFIRGDDFSYAHSEDMANAWRANATTNGLMKRSHANVQACATASCTDCHSVFDGNFNAFTCLEATNTACIIVSDLDDAKVNYWNHAGCNHHESTYNGCGQPATNVAAPGTNSIGVQLGC